MFREMTRKNRQLPPEDCVRILTERTRGVLSVNGDGGYPYGIPMNHFYDERDGKIYFHCGTEGHKLDALRRSPKASLCVCDEGFREEGDWAWSVKSVVVFGTVRVVSDMARIVDVTTRLGRKFTQDEELIAQEIQDAAHRTLLLEFSPEHICGKLVREA